VLFAPSRKPLEKLSIHWEINVSSVAKPDLSQHSLHSLEGETRIQRNPLYPDFPSAREISMVVLMERAIRRGTHPFTRSQGEGMGKAQYPLRE
ncbi:hypothetical protein BSL67_16685, partial [Acinetobacter baylyi]